MLYTTKETVKLELHGQAAADDTLLDWFVEAVSRAVDVHCTGVPKESDNYFMLEDVVNERLRAQIDIDGRIVCYPHKPLINSVSSMSYSARPQDTSYSIPVANVTAYGPQVEAYPAGPAVDFPSRIWVKISYNGGYSGSTIGLPKDFVDTVTLLCVRMYREAETAFSDAIGVAELSTMIYTKAWPDRAIKQLLPYVRRRGWHFIA